MNIEEFHFQTIEELHENGCANIPQQEGLYIVMAPSDFEITFLPNTTATTEFGDRSMIYQTEVLQSKFERSDRKILYIGKADGAHNTLRERIRQLIRYGYCEAFNHRGGRAFWQIENSKNLLIGYNVCEHARELERVALMEYYATYGTYPVANWQA